MGILSQEVAANSRAMNELEMSLPASCNGQRNGELVSNMSRNLKRKHGLIEGPEVGYHW